MGKKAEQYLAHPIGACRVRREVGPKQAKVARAVRAWGIPECELAAIEVDESPS